MVDGHYAFDTSKDAEALTSARQPSVKLDLDTSTNQTGTPGATVASACRSPWRRTRGCRGRASRGRDGFRDRALNTCRGRAALGLRQWRYDPRNGAQATIDRRGRGRGRARRAASSPSTSVVPRRSRRTPGRYPRKPSPPSRRGCVVLSGAKATVRSQRPTPNTRAWSRP